MSESPLAKCFLAAGFVIIGVGNIAFNRDVSREAFAQEGCDPEAGPCCAGGQDPCCVNGEWTCNCGE